MSSQKKKKKKVILSCNFCSGPQVYKSNTQEKSEKHHKSQEQEHGEALIVQITDSVRCIKNGRYFKNHNVSVYYTNLIGRWKAV